MYYFNTRPASHRRRIHTLPMIIQGTGELQWDGEDVGVFKQGETFLNHAERKHVLVRNPGEVELKIVASHVIETGVSNVEMCE